MLLMTGGEVVSCQCQCVKQPVKGCRVGGRLVQIYIFIYAYDLAIYKLVSQCSQTGQVNETYIL